MFHWICPECGREIPPAVTECPACDPKALAAEAAKTAPVADAIAPTPPALPVVETTAAEPRAAEPRAAEPRAAEPRPAEPEAVAPKVIAPEVVAPKVVAPEPEPEIDPLLALAEMIYAAQSGPRTEPKREAPRGEAHAPAPQPEPAAPAPVAASPVSNGSSGLQDLASAVAQVPATPPPIPAPRAPVAAAPARPAIPAPQTIALLPAGQALALLAPPAPSPQPVITPEPVAAPEPAVIAIGPVVALEPAMALGPAAIALEPAIAIEPAIALEPAIAIEPVVTPAPVVAREPVVAPEPVLAPEPIGDRLFEPKVSPEPLSAPAALAALPPSAGFLGVPLLEAPGVDSSAPPPATPQAPAEPPAAEPTAAVEPSVEHPPSGSWLNLAPMQNYKAATRQSLQPADLPTKIVAHDSGPRITLPGPTLPPELVSLQEAGVVTVLGGPAKSKKAAGPKKASAMPGWMVSFLVTMALLISGVAVVFYFSPLSHPSADAKPAPQTVEAPTVAPLSHSLADTIEVTGFRILVDYNKKSEIHYLVVNHSAQDLSDMTVYVTLHASGAKPGQPPLCRFSFRAPSLKAFEVKEMTASIEKFTRSVTVPDWQDLRAEVQVAP